RPGGEGRLRQTPGTVQGEEAISRHPRVEVIRTRMPCAAGTRLTSEGRELFPAPPEPGIRRRCGEGPGWTSTAGSSHCPGTEDRMCEANCLDAACSPVSRQPGGRCHGPR